MPQWALPNFHGLLDAEVEVVQVLSLAAWISHHYLYAWGELSSSGRIFHPGERGDAEQIPR